MKKLIIAALLSIVSVSAVAQVRKPVKIDHQINGIAQDSFSISKYAGIKYIMAFKILDNKGNIKTVLQDTASVIVLSSSVWKKRGKLWVSSMRDEYIDYENIYRIWYIDKWVKPISIIEDKTPHNTIYPFRWAGDLKGDY